LLRLFRLALALLDLLDAVLRPRFLSPDRLLVSVEVLPLQDSHPSLEPPVLLELLALEDEAAVSCCLPLFREPLVLILGL
jgi:hypothetical protein